MERLKKWFGIPDENISKNMPRDGTLFNIPTFPAEPLAPQKPPKPDPQEQAQQSRPDQQAEQTHLVNKHSKVTESGLEQMLEPVRAQILKVVPLQEGDCLSCKLIGVSVCYGASLAVILTYRRAQKAYTGIKRKMFALYAVSLFTGMTLLGTARLFDMSFFERPNGPDGQRRSPRELIEEDMNSLRDLVSRFSGSSASQSVNPDSTRKKDS